MGQYTISDSALAFSLVLVLIAVILSYREKLRLEKEILWSVGRAVVQLSLIGYVLKSLFKLNNPPFTILMVLFICINAAYSAGKRGHQLPHALVISLIAIISSTALTLSLLLITHAIRFVPMQVIPISGMIAGNAMVTVGLCYNHLHQRFNDQQQSILEMLSLGASTRLASSAIIRSSIHSALIPTIDSAKTLGLVSLPGMMSGLIFAGVDPLLAIRYQIMVTFMLLATASIATIAAAYLAYRQFYNSQQQLVLLQEKRS